MSQPIKKLLQEYMQCFFFFMKKNEYIHNIQILHCFELNFP